MILMRFLSVVAVLVGLAGPAAAQIPGLQAQPEAADTAPGAELDDLIRILEDDAARNRLIDALRAAAEEAEGVPPPPSTVASQLAEYSGEIATGLVGLVAATAEFVDRAGQLLATDRDRMARVFLGVGAVIAAAFLMLMIARFVAGTVHRRLETAAATGGVVRRVGLVSGALGAEAGTVLAAWGVAWLVALWTGQPGRVNVNQALFLNAFIVIEMSKVAVRTLLGPRSAALRPLPITDISAAYWYFWLSRLISVIGYTFLFVAPILATNVSWASAQAARIIVLVAALTMTCIIILQNRDAVRRRLTAWARRNNSDVVGRTLVVLAGVWHIIAIVYLVAVFLLWLIRPDQALPFVLSATLHTVVAIAVGLLLLAFITRLAAGGMRLPDDVKERLPLLEHRLNAFVPNVLQVVRIVIMVAVVIAIAQAWAIADVIGWLAAETGQRFVGTVIASALIILVGGAIYLAVASWVEYRLNPNYGTVPTPRERTLLALFRNAVTIVLAVLVVMLVLSELGVNIGPLLAGAGVVGLAIGFGAQKLVQDIISGAFIQFENAMNEGDVVTAGGITGVVEKLTIRSVSLRSLDGVYHVIPFSSVDAISNFMKHFSYHVAAIGVAYRERIPDVKQAMADAFEQLRATELGDEIIGDFEMQGVTDFGDSSITVRGRIKTVAGMQWTVGRAYNEIVKEIFDARGIEIPYPHMTVYMGQGKDGKAPPLYIAQTDSDTMTASPTQKRRTRAAAKAGPAPRRRTRRKTKQDTMPDLPGGEEL